VARPNIMFAAMQVQLTKWMRIGEENFGFL
jgi:hypothetical protein